MEGRVLSPEVQLTVADVDSSYKVRDSDHGSIYDVERAGARSFGPKHSAEFFAKDRNFRSRSQKDREAFDSQRKAVAMNKRLEALLTKPDAKDASEINPVSDLERDIVQNDQKAMKNQRIQKKNEARRRKDGEKARNSYRQRLLKEAEEGGYTINEDEMIKRLDSYMKKREVSFLLVLMSGLLISYRKNIKRKKQSGVLIWRLPHLIQQKDLSLILQHKFVLRLPFKFEPLVN
jgi:hypothetical protein